MIVLKKEERFCPSCQLMREVQESFRVFSNGDVQLTLICPGCHKTQRIRASNEEILDWLANKE